MRILRAGLPGGRADGRPPAGAFAWGRPVGWQLSDRWWGLQSEEGPYSTGELPGRESRGVPEFPAVRDTRLETTPGSHRRRDPKTAPVIGVRAEIGVRVEFTELRLKFRFTAW